MPSTPEPYPRAVLLVRGLSALSMVLLAAITWRLGAPSVMRATSFLVAAELVALAGVLAVSILFIERLAIRIIRTRGGRNRS